MDEKVRFGQEATGGASDVPVLPLRNAVFFPGGIMPISVGRPKTCAMIKAAQETGAHIAVIPQKDGRVDDPGSDGLHSTGTMARIIKVLEPEEDGIHLVLEGGHRFHVLGLTQTEPYLRARVVEVQDIAMDPLHIEALVMNVKKIAREVACLEPELPPGAKAFLQEIDEPGRLADLIAANMDVSVEEKMEVLNLVDVAARLENVLGLLSRKLEMLKLSKHIDAQAKGGMHRNHHEYYLRQQMRALQEELGETFGHEEDLDELTQKLKDVQLPEEAENAAKKELRRLQRMHPSSSEYTVGRTYLEWFADLPWNTASTDSLDIPKARQLLERNHCGLEKVKKRMIEYLAVRTLKENMKGPILCMVGPPGVGKTSLGKSIAETLGRKFHRISLGGVHDDAEVRGHRRTYVGALPGRIIQGLKRAGTNNPVFVLDEIDKVSHDFRGDPASALLEVLDPEENHTFSDHYLEVPFDLSKVLFIATANRLDPVPPALRDRMEVLQLPGYTHEEKQRIATKHLIPKVLGQHGLTDGHVEIESNALASIIIDYTREAGVRNLERMLASVVRGVAVEVAEGKTDRTVIEKSNLFRYLGPEKFHNEMAEQTKIPGVATGLGWTDSGGDIFFVEATKMDGKGELTLTGQLGDVMKESAHAARSYLRARSAEFGASARFWEKTDIHIHVPAGGIAKDGPAAGVTIVAALASLITETLVRSAVAMTGEITLRGHVLPVEGVREKILAALRTGVEEAILPERNRKDLYEVPEDMRQQLKFHFVSRIDEALDVALGRADHP